MVGKKHTHMFQNCTSKSCLNGHQQEHLSDDLVQKLLVNVLLDYLLLVNTYYSCKNKSTGEESSETTVGGV